MTSAARARSELTTVILGTGGTIAGTAATSQDSIGYRAAQRSVQALVAAVPALQGLRLQTEQVVQIDSKDMSHDVWLALARCAGAHLARPEVGGVVVTHGTDTLEETAYFLHRVLAPDKPLVLTAAMRPATALLADGPQNLLDAVTLARLPEARGVMAVLNGRVHIGADLRKVHGHALDAFSSGDAGMLGLIEDGQLRSFRAWPVEVAHPAAAVLLAGLAAWPVVDIVTSHAGARAAVVDALVASGAQGLVVAGTGNGSVHAELEQALARALARGVWVVRASRCAFGGVVGGVVEGVVGNPAASLPSAGPLTPPQARIELMLDLIVRA